MSTTLAPAAAVSTAGDLGLPPKFSTWRPGQYSAIDQACQSLSTGNRMVVVNAPTGAGMSGIEAALADAPVCGAVGAVVEAAQDPGLEPNGSALGWPQHARLRAHTSTTWRKKEIRNGPKGTG
jgi:hypothetical protein